MDPEHSTNSSILKSCHLDVSLSEPAGSVDEELGDVTDKTFNPTLLPKTGQ